MTKHSELRNFQLQIINELKVKSYEELFDFPAEKKCEMPYVTNDFSITIYKSVSKKGVILIEVKLKDCSTQPSLPEIFKQYNVSVVSSGSIDGFEIYPNGEIVDMHDGEYDD